MAGEEQSWAGNCLSLSCEVPWDQAERFLLGCCMRVGAVLELRACGETGSTDGGIVGRLGAQIPGLRVVSWADRCPLRRALLSHVQQSPASCGLALCSTLEAEGGQGPAERMGKLERACRQPPQTTPAARAHLLTLRCRLSLLTRARGAEFRLLSSSSSLASAQALCPVLNLEFLV